MVIFYNLSEYFTATHHGLSFCVKGPPPVQERPKITFKTRSKPTYYDPSKTTKRNWRKSLKQQLVHNNVSFPVFGSNPILDKGITVYITFYMARPAMDYVTKKKCRFLKDEIHHFPNQKDIDNMLKFVLDAMQEIVYLNDCVVCTLHSQKKFIDDGDHDFESQGPYTEITLEQELLSRSCN